MNVTAQQSTKEVCLVYNTRQTSIRLYHASCSPSLAHKRDPLLFLTQTVIAHLGERFCFLSRVSTAPSSILVPKPLATAEQELVRKPTRFRYDPSLETNGSNPQANTSHSSQVPRTTSKFQTLQSQEIHTKCEGRGSWYEAVQTTSKESS